MSAPRSNHSITPRPTNCLPAPAALVAATKLSPRSDPHSTTPRPTVSPPATEEVKLWRLKVDKLRGEVEALPAPGTSVTPTPIAVIPTPAGEGNHTGSEIRWNHDPWNPSQISDDRGDCFRRSASFDGKRTVFGVLVPVRSSPIRLRCRRLRRVRSKGR